ncbi:MAG: peptidoglycan-associated lipoprotein Pal [Thermodesulfovibrionales bacterium]
MKKILFLLLAFALLFACAEKKVTTTQEEITPAEETTTLPPTEEVVEVAEEAQVSEAAMETGMSLEEVLRNDIHFDYDRYDIKENDKATLKTIADWLIQNSDVSIRIEGHCDERGTNEYNLGLGDRRAGATKSYLMTLGVPSSRILTISYGEERPLCTNSDEGCWSQNRRAHFSAAQ